MDADVVVMGAGLSGLVDAILLAEIGRRVVVIEQHSIPGGYLQQFSRKGTVFDVGFHYMGQTDPGRPLRRMLEHLDVWRRLRVIPFPDDAAIVVRCGDSVFGYPSRWNRFREKLEAEFPHERAAIRSFCDDVDVTCGGFRWFSLAEPAAAATPSLTGASFADAIAERISDPILREILGVQSFNIGLHDHEIPWTKHVLALRANFDVTCRIDGGGGALVAALVERARELGVVLRMRTEVVRLDCESRRVRGAITARGERIEGEIFIAACHPKVVVGCLDDTALKPVFKDRILGMRESRGALQVFLRLSAPPHSLDESCVLVVDHDAEGGTPPIPVVLVVNPSGEELAERGGPRLEAMTYVDYEPFAAWAERPVMRRGDEYERFKRALADRVVEVVAKMAPEIPSLIEDVYVATPLSDAWYTRSPRGGVFGVSHDVSQQGLNRPHARTRLKNLFFTGHSIHMPGICGVCINAFETCHHIRGDGALFGLVAG